MRLIVWDIEGGNMDDAAQCCDIMYMLVAKGLWLPICAALLGRLGARQMAFALVSF